MVNVSVARRYARALAAAAGPNADAVLTQLTELMAFFDANPQVLRTMSNPALSGDQRMKATVGLIGAMTGAQPVLGNLLKLLTDRNRFGVLPAIARQYREIVDAQLGRVRGKVTTAVKLPEAQLTTLRTSLETMTQKKVVLETAVDPSLLGGVVAQVGSRTLDGSIRSQLQSLAQTLTTR